MNRLSRGTWRYWDHEYAELHLGGATARFHVCFFLSNSISSSDVLLLARFLHDHGSAEWPCLKPHIEPTRLAFLTLLVSVAMYLIFHPSPSPSPIANVHCVGIYPTDNVRASTHHTPPLPGHTHPIFPSPTLHFSPSQDDVILDHPSRFSSILVPGCGKPNFFPPNLNHSRTTE